MLVRKFAFANPPHQEKITTIFTVIFKRAHLTFFQFWLYGCCTKLLHTFDYYAYLRIRIRTHLL
jgi:hypothetical protein